MQLRKLATKEVLERKKRRNQVIVGLVLVTIMILSTAGYAINREKSESFRYKEFEFSRSERGWQVMKQPFSLITRFLPQDVENISLFGSWSVNDFANKEIYFVAYRGEAKIAASEIARNLPFRRAQYACFEDDANLSGCEDLPLKTCLDEVIFINYLSSNVSSGNLSENETKHVEARIFQNDSCVAIESEYEDLIKAADRFLFDVYGII